MAYPFVDVIGGALTIEDWFKNQCMHIGTQKSALRLLSIVQTQLHHYEEAMPPEVLKKMQKLESKLKSKGKSLLSQDFIENLDLDDYQIPVWKEKPSRADLLKLKHAEESHTPDINKLVDEKNRRFTMEEFNDIYEDMQVQEKIIEDPKKAEAERLKKAATGSKILNRKAKKQPTNKSLNQDLNDTKNAEQELLRAGYSPEFIKKAKEEGAI